MGRVGSATLHIELTPVLEKAFRVSGVPEKLLPLFALSHDLRWTWRADVRALFEFLDPAAWRRAGGNPVKLFREVPAERLWHAAEDPTYQAELLAKVRRLTEEDLAEPRHPAARELVARGERIAYFSAEFGLTEVLPIYAGGLGVLAGDHLKSASDLGVPLTGVGLFYREGYFRQVVDDDGMQNEAYPVLEPDELPLSIAETPDGSAADRHGGPRGPDGAPAHPHRAGRARAAAAARLEPARERGPRPRDHARASTAAASRRASSRRSCSGSAALRALDKLGLKPTIRHINEGHAAFVSLERIRRLVQEEHLSFAEAREVATTGNIFTTHTPVPAGIDVFTPELLWKYFGGYVNELGITLRRALRARPRGGRRSRASSSRWPSSRCASRRTRMPCRACTRASRAGSGGA